MLEEGSESPTIMDVQDTQTLVQIAPISRPVSTSELPKSKATMDYISLFKYWDGIIFAPVPLPSVTYAAVEILRTLMPLFLKLRGVKALYILDNEPVRTFNLVKVALNFTGAAVRSCPILATYQVTTVAAALGRSLLQAETAYLRLCQARAMRSNPSNVCIGRIIAKEAAFVAEPTQAAGLEHPIGNQDISNALQVSAPRRSHLPAAVSTSSSIIKTSIKDCPPPGFPIPNASNDKLYRGVLSVANRAFLTGRAASILGFPEFAAASYLVYADNLGLVAAYSLKTERKRPFLTAKEWKEVQSNLQFIKKNTTSAPIKGSMVAVPEVGSERAVEAIALIHNTTRDGLFSAFASSKGLVQYTEVFHSMTKQMDGNFNLPGQETQIRGEALEANSQTLMLTTQAH